MEKAGVLSIVLMVVMTVAMIFAFQTCTKGGDENFGYLDYSKTANSVIYSSPKNQNEKQIIKGETDLVAFEFDTEGAVLSSYKIKTKHEKIDSNVELIIPSQKAKPFSVFWGNDRTHAIKDNYSFSDLSTEKEKIYLFQCDFLDDLGNIFTMNKKFTLLNDSFLFKVSISFDTKVKKEPDFGNEGYAYSLYFGPQLGPEYSKLSKKNANYYEERLIHENYNGKKGKVKTDIFWRENMIAKTQKYNDLLFYRVPKERNLNWVALSGKYFLFIAEVPNRERTDIFYESNSVEKDKYNFDMVYENEIYLTQKLQKNSENGKRFSTMEEINYYFYLGPRNLKALTVAEKSFGRKDLNFSKLSSKGFLGLNVIVEKCVSFINYGIKGTGIKNWGWSIVIFTILLKLVTFGLNKKSFVSSVKMQSLAPKMAEIREKYKDRPQEIQIATAQLYKKENISPMAGCLPLLIQFPVLIAVYAFINNSYQLRNAAFFGWISDLSSPDALFSWGKALPLLGWTSFNLLPILYILTQFVSTIFMMPPKQKKEKQGDAKKPKIDSQQMQQKFMQFGMPFLFFFLLYNAPSGLFVYWITMNIVTLIQQIIFRKTMNFDSEDSSKGSPNKPKGFLLKIKKA